MEWLMKSFDLRRYDETVIKFVIDYVYCASFFSAWIEYYIFMILAIIL